ncbi:hypothetical protein KEJ49_07175 [Candidatus Bathyarchaeota archaeon]|nr:hypothetical protein [Candidatus Bathyarchaeota archaeon]
MVKTTIEIDEHLWKLFSFIVFRDRGERKKNEVIAELIRDYIERRGLPEDPLQLEYILKIEEERASFMKMLDELLRNPFCVGKYVAVLHGSIVGCDEDKGRLMRNMYERFGYVPIYVDRVVPGGRRVEVPSPELART